MATLDTSSNRSASLLALANRTATVALPLLALSTAFATGLIGYDAWGATASQSAKVRADLELLRSKAATLADLERIVDRLRHEANEVAAADESGSDMLISRIVDAGAVDLIDLRGLDGNLPPPSLPASLTVRGDLVELAGFLDALAADPPAVVLDDAVLRLPAGSPAGELTLSGAHGFATVVPPKLRRKHLGVCSAARPEVSRVTPLPAPPRSEQASVLGFARMGRRSAALIRDAMGRVHVVAPPRTPGPSRAG